LLIEQLQFSFSDVRTIKLYGTGSATANNVANVTIPSSGRIRGVQVCISVDSITDNAQIDLEVSRASATEINVNGAQQCVSQVSVRNNFVTSGMVGSAVATFFPVDVPVTQGQIIYLHAVVVGTVTYFATFLLQYE
jgi:hypothetical protein